MEVISKYLNIVRLKYRGIKSQFRLSLLKLRGLNIDGKGTIGKIICDWPSKLFIGKDCIVTDGNYFWFKYPFSKENYMKIGDKTHIGRNCAFNINTYIEFGKHCMIGDYSQFADINHQTKIGIPMDEQPINTGPIVFGDDVWIGVGCIVLRGVQLGDGVVVAAGSLINKSIPANEIWGGVPAKKLGERKA